MTADSLDRVPPNSLEAEMAVLGAMMHDEAALAAAVERLTPEDFYRAEHRCLFGFLVAAFDKDKPIDFVLLKQALADAGKLEEVGGDEYLITLSESFGSAETVAHYADVVKDKARRRQLLAAAGAAIADAYSADDIEDVMQRAAQRAFELTDTARCPGLATLGSALKAAMLHEGRRGLDTGLPGLDAMTGGLCAGDLILLAARTSVGKSALAHQIALYVACEGVAVVLFTLEMTKEAVALRQLAQRAEVNAWRLVRGQLSQQETKAAVYAQSVLADVPCLIDDTSHLSALQIRARARRLVATKGVKLVIVDYTQLVLPDGLSRGASREQEVASISRQLKTLARELHVPVLALAQLSRKAEEEGVPRLGHLRESGALEQDADLVIFLWPDDKDRRLVHLRLAKHRHGPTAEMDLVWRPEFVKFAEAVPDTSGVPVQRSQANLEQVSGQAGDDGPNPF
jgi:replicative DNA helicase